MIKVCFLGSGEFSVRVLNELIDSEVIDVFKVVSQVDKKVGRKQLLTPTPLKSFALEKGYNVVEAESNDSIVVALGELDFDFLIVCDFGMILSDEVINIPTIDTLNVHASLLPKYRGASPIQAALLNGDELSGVSVMSVVKELDAGPIYAMSEEPIDIDDNYISLVDKFGTLGGKLLAEVLFQIKNNNLEPFAQPNNGLSFCGKITKADGLIEFKNDTAIQILNKFKAFIVWPNIFFIFKDIRFKIIDVSMTSIELEPGEFLFDGELYVGTKNGSLVINEFQPESKKTMKPADFLFGNPNFFA